MLLPGPTFPNQRFLIASTAHGLIDDVIASIINYPRSGTMFDLLNRYGIQWINYHDVPVIRLLDKRLAGAPGFRGARVLKLVAGQLLSSVEAPRSRGNPVHRKQVSTGAGAHDRPPASHQALFHYAATGMLPPVSIVDPDFELWPEENPQDIRIGEGFSAAVINAVMHGKGWPHTLLIWLYDEHGGYYDHVPPPPAVQPDDVLPHNLQATAASLRWLVKHSGL